LSVTTEQVIAAQAVYTKRNLAAYDFVVLGVSPGGIHLGWTAKRLMDF
jgi:hypothetical protein